MNTEATINIGRVRAAINLHNEIDELQSQWNELTEPMVRDLSLLPILYNLYLQMYERRGMLDKANKVYNRQKFLLVVLYLYSPRTLAGGKMVVGLRRKLTELFGLSASSTVSDNITDLVFNYDKYIDFRKDADMIYREMRDALNTMQYTPLP